MSVLIVFAGCDDDASKTDEQVLSWNLETWNVVSDTEFGNSWNVEWTGNEYPKINSWYTKNTWEFIQTYSSGNTTVNFILDTGGNLLQKNTTCETYKESWISPNAEYQWMWSINWLSNDVFSWIYNKYISNYFSGNYNFICDKTNSKYISIKNFGKSSNGYDIDNISELSDAKFSIVWNVVWNPKSIYVRAINTGANMDEYYKLKSYKSWDKQRTYNIDPKFENIKKWKNIYIFVAEYDDGSLYMIYTMRNVDNLVDRYCILDICSETTRYTENVNWIIYQYKNKEDKNKKEKWDSYLEYKKWEYIIYNWDEPFVFYTKTVKKIWNYYIKQYKESGCGWYNMSQEIYDLDGILLKDADLKDVLNYSNEIIFWNLVFKSSVVFKSKNSILKNVPTKINNIMWEIKSNKNPNWLKSYRYISSDFNIQIWDTWVNYNLENPKWWSSYWINLHWLDTSDYIITYNYDKSNINSEVYDIKNLTYTKKILDTFSGNASQIVDKDWNQITSENIKGNRLPIFGRYPVDEEFELITTVRWHRYNYMAEMCKPAIYVYDKQNRNHEVQIKMPKNGFFTHLEPNLNILNWRKYKAKDGKVIVDWQDFDYLYYAVKVPNYTFNTGWWIVSWSESDKFFDYILPEIGFNEKEKSDFITYWSERFKSDKIYFISRKYNDEIKPRVDLKFSISPNNVSRVIMEAIEFEPWILKTTDWSLENKYFQKMQRWWDLDVFERGGVFVDGEGKMTIY